MSPEERLYALISSLYPDRADWLWGKLIGRLQEFRQRHPHLHENHTRFTQEDAILITYGDQFQRPPEQPLKSLHTFIRNHLGNLITGVHILPFFPFSSDDGFAVIDYYRVDPRLGTWEEIEELGKHYRLMVDAVVNHISSQSDWAEEFRQGKDPYGDYFIIPNPSFDYSHVFRPRDHPLLTPVETRDGWKKVWTTFSADQLDLNYTNPQVLLEIIDVLLFYIEKGASIIRLDAIGYIWKESGTRCLNLPQAHMLVKIFRAALDIACPSVFLITETNVPHEENIAYFGDLLTIDSKGLQRGDEAQMVYQFSLAPLVLHTFQSSKVSAITDWLDSLSIPSGEAYYFNFIASHDGIGIVPAKWILSESEVQALIEQTLKHGGLVSHRSDSDGNQSVYELNITLFDALNDPANPDEILDARRFLASQALMLSLAGVPGIYVHSLFGSRNCLRCVEETGQARSINREKFDLIKLKEELLDVSNLKHRIFEEYKKLLKVRRLQPAFHPAAPQKVIDSNPHVFCLLRQAMDDVQTILCLVNVSPETQVCQMQIKAHELSSNRWIELLSGREFLTNSQELTLQLEQFETMWLATEG
jgi:sucrose phosphorylase